MVLWGTSLVFLWFILRWRHLSQEVTFKPIIKRDLSGLLVRTLVLCNTLFFIQHIMDFQYLLLGSALPENMTYAEYAHRGAYPLIVTTLLAASFVLLCVRSGTENHQSRFMRWNVYLWLLQNIALTGFTIWRLVLYIEAYGLTRWRLATALWIILIAIGLLLIILRIHWNRENHWLISANVRSTACICALCSLLNIDGFIADWNIERALHLYHKSDSTNMIMRKSFLDIEYLEKLGPAALPALRRLRAALPATNKELTETILHLERQTSHQLSTWRGWNWTAHQNQPDSLN